MNALSNKPILAGVKIVQQKLVLEKTEKQKMTDRSVLTLNRRPIRTRSTEFPLNIYDCEDSISITWSSTNQISSATELRLRSPRLVYHRSLSFKALICFTAIFLKCCSLIGWTDIQINSFCVEYPYFRGKE